MKDKEAHVGQHVAMVNDPRRKLGTIVAVVGKTAHVCCGRFDDGAEQYVAFYGLKMLVEYVE